METPNSLIAVSEWVLLVAQAIYIYSLELWLFFATPTQEVHVTDI